MRAERNSDLNQKPQAQAWLASHPSTFFLVDGLINILASSLEDTFSGWHDNESNPSYKLGRRADEARLSINCSKKGCTVRVKFHSESIVLELKKQYEDIAKVEAITGGEFLLESEFTNSGSNNKGFKLLFAILKTEALGKLTSDFQEIEVNESEELTTTERESIIKARIGQGVYKKNLITLWGACAVTGIEFEPILKASHIKPWKDSDNIERLDKFNGLLLSSLYDDLFDKGFISFEDSGEIIFSKKLPIELIGELQLDKSIKIKTQSEHHKYLKHHRDVVLKTLES